MNRFADTGCAWREWGRPTPAGGLVAGQGDAMAMIIEFRSSAVRAEQPLAEARQAGAQIIIFPGVRRERHAEPPKPRRREKGRTKRDRLEIPD